MDWLNLHVSTIDSPEFVGEDPVGRATWLCLQRFCIGQENFGLIADCAEWPDRKWQQIVRVTEAEVKRPSALWVWEGASLRVQFYPADKQREVQAKRDAGKLTASKRWPKLQSSADSSAICSATSSAHAEGNGRERKGSKTALAVTQSSPSRQTPTLDEWLSEAKAKHPDWPRRDVESAWNHYEAQSWKRGKTPITKWRACMATCYGNWTQRNPGRAYATPSPGTTTGITEPTSWKERIRNHRPGCAYDIGQRDEQTTWNSLPRASQELVIEELAKP